MIIFRCFCIVLHLLSQISQKGQLSHQQHYAMMVGVEEDVPGDKEGSTPCI